VVGLVDGKSIKLGVVGVVVGVVGAVVDGFPSTLSKKSFKK
jgi:hypothetical protein